MQLSSLLLCSGTARLALAAYSVSEDYMQNGFFSNWDFFTDSDPTHGYVTYVDQGTAQSDGLISTNSDGSIYIGVDYTNTASGSGRNSVCITSTATYTHYLTVVDIGHMPGGICGTWPAFWSVGPNWPNEGEIDIIEGANDQQNNYMTLHAGADCSISSSADSLLQSATQDCNVADNGNEGCSFHDANSNSYGSQFNAQGGGVYATEWTSEGVSIWFWPAGGAPSDALGDSPDPTGWGTPTSTWGGSGCDWDTHFMDHSLVFDTTFCGDWASNTFQSCAAANGGQTCQEFVQNNPSAFKEAYWQVNALKVYTDDGSSAPASTSAAPVSTSTPVAATATTEAPMSSSIQTTLATSSALLSSSVSVEPVSEGSTGGIFLPGQMSSSAVASSTSSAVSIDPLSEGSTGGISFPGPTSSSSAATSASSSVSVDPLSEGSAGGIFLPGPTSSSDAASPTKSSSGDQSSKGSSGSAHHHTSASSKVTATHSKSKAVPTSSATPATTNAPDTTTPPVASSSASSSSTDTCLDENSTGGVYMPAPTNQPAYEEEGAHGKVYGPGPKLVKRAVAFPETDGLAKVLGKPRYPIHHHHYEGRDGSK